MVQWSHAARGTIVAFVTLSGNSSQRRERCPRSLFGFGTSGAAGTYDWRTVTVKGSVELLSTAASQVEDRELQDAVQVLRSAVPAVRTARAQVPGRAQLFRLHADLIAGREARPQTRRALRSASVPLPAA